MSLITVKDLKNEGDAEIPSPQQCIEFRLRSTTACRWRGVSNPQCLKNPS
ncbi:hypothetical protein [Nostoc sp.]